MPTFNSNNSANFYTDMIEQAIHEIGVKPKNEPIIIQGRNPNIDIWYNLWKGIAPWRKYKIHYTDGREDTEATYLSINLPKRIAETWANNYANENTVVTIPNEQENGEKNDLKEPTKVNKPNERLQEILTLNKFFSRFNNFTEMFTALGIGATLVLPEFQEKQTTFEDGKIENTLEINPTSEINIKMIGGRRVIPITVDDGKITECAFVTFKTGGLKFQIHVLNEQKQYVIAEIEGNGKNGSYTLDIRTLKTFETKTDVPLFQIWQPNIAHDDDIDSSIGVSIYESSMDAFRQCDLAYTSYWKELKLGQKVLFVSSDIDIIDENGNKTQPYDPDNEAIVHTSSGTDGTTDMKEFNGQLRIQPIEQALTFHMNIAASNCGLGQNFYEFSGGRPLQTATAIIAKNVELYKNIIKQENYATDTLREMVRAIQVVNNEMLSGKQSITFKKLQDIQITYDDNIMQDTQSKKQQDLAEVNAGIMTVAEFRAEWYDEDIMTAQEFLQNNAMLVDKYLPSLQAGAIMPEQFVDIVYGSKVKDRQKIIDYITEFIKPATPEEGYADETAYEQEKPGTDEPKQEEPKKEENEPEKE